MRWPRLARNPPERKYPGTPMSEFSASCATATRCRETATASKCIGRLRRTRRNPGGSGRGSGRRHRIGRLPGLRRSRLLASGCCRRLLAGLVLVLLVLRDGLAQVTFELIEVGLRRNALVLESRHFLVGEVDSQSPLQRFLELLRVEVIVVVPTAVIERHRHHGGAEQEPHLAARHAFLELRHGVRDEVVALLNVHLVDAARGEEGADDEANGW